jgi:TorA maturation chaperone TorD
MKPLLATCDLFPGSNMRRALQELVQFTDSIPTSNLSELHIKLSADYARLFLSLNKFPAHPSESVYREGFLMQNSRDEVLRTYWNHGIDKKTDYTEPEDHLAIELSFMAYLAEQAHEALSKKEDTVAIGYIRAQVEFLEKHLLKWVPQLVKDILRTGQTPFYKSLAVLTQDFLEIDLVATRDQLKELQ